MGRTKRVITAPKPDPLLSNVHRTIVREAHTPIRKKISDTNRADLLAFCEHVQQFDLEGVLGKDLLLQYTSETIAFESYILNVESCYHGLLTLCDENN